MPEFIRFRGKKLWVTRGGMLDLSNYGLLDGSKIEGLKDLTTLKYLFLNNNRIKNFSWLNSLGTLPNFHFISLKSIIYITP